MSLHQKIGHFTLRNKNLLKNNTNQERKDFNQVYISFVTAFNNSFHPILLQCSNASAAPITILKLNLRKYVVDSDPQRKLIYFPLEALYSTSSA